MCDECALRACHDDLTAGSEWHGSRFVEEVPLNVPRSCLTSTLTANRYKVGGPDWWSGPIEAYDRKVTFPVSMS